MNKPIHPLEKLQFYVTVGYPCSYLPKQLAQSLIATPKELVNAAVYSALIEQGFRRSGDLAYRPHCEHCNACISMRIPVNLFKATRSQKRVLKKHQHLSTQILPAAFYDHHFKLYTDYQLARHPESFSEESENGDVRTQYKHFLCASNVDTVMVEFREGDTLKMVSIVDIVNEGISAVYTFYDPSDVKASYGTYNILWQIQWATLLNVQHVYLGYWIQESQKMAYKDNFKPAEKLIDGNWVLENNPT